MVFVWVDERTGSGRTKVEHVDVVEVARAVVATKEHARVLVHDERRAVASERSELVEAQSNSL